MSQVKEIIQGWKNLAFKNTKVEDIAVKRIELCTTCPDRSNYPNEFNISSTCKICGCVLKAKVRSTNSKCPKDLW